jgi:MoxR-like ATPase
MTTNNEINNLKEYLTKHIIGQEYLVQRLLIALLADGHLLVEGAPGLAKTKAIKDLSQGIDAAFHRIQFTPDLLPSDVIGTDIFIPEERSFKFQSGPIFHNLVLADEINRSPAKVQSALLEAMAERQVSVGSKTYKLPELFLVMATQNPIDQEGTYPLPEAQLDRFLMHIKVDYPSINSERAILKLARDMAQKKPQQNSTINVKKETILAARQEVLDMHMEPVVEEYIVQLIHATRDPKPYSQEFASYLEYGASPRGTINLDRCARAYAWLQGKDYVSPEDVQAVAHDVLRHRLILSFEAEAAGKDADQIISYLLNVVPVA